MKKAESIDLNDFSNDELIKLKARINKDIQSRVEKLQKELYPTQIEKVQV